MAYIAHLGGEQLAQTKAKAVLNFTEVIADRSEIVAGELIVDFGGMQLPQFRDACRTNFAKIALDAGGTGYEVIDDGDTIWKVREKLQTNFDIVEALA